MIFVIKHKHRGSYLDAGGKKGEWRYHLDDARVFERLGAIQKSWWFDPDIMEIVEVERTIREVFTKKFKG